MTTKKLHVFSAAMLLAVSLWGVQTAAAQTAKALSSAAATTFTAPAAGSDFSLRGKTLQGADFDLSKIRGKPVLVFYWSTDCGVCKTKMPEIRKQVADAKGQFAVVLVNADRLKSNLESYETLVQKIAVNDPANKSPDFHRFWKLDPSYKDTMGTVEALGPRLPVTILIDKSGKVRSSVVGRFDDGVWAALKQI